MADGFSRVDWAKRSAEFGPLEEHITSWGEHVVTMPVRTPGITDPNLDWALWHHWLELPNHPRILDAVMTTKTSLLLRYAALDWSARPLPGLVEAEVKRIATIGIELTRVFDFLAVSVIPEQLGWFACPFVKLDIQGDPRVGFLNPAGSVALSRRLAPEALEAFPEAGPGAFVFAIAQLLLQLTQVTKGFSQTPLGLILTRCIEKSPERRFASLAQLRDALAVVGGARKSQFFDRLGGAWDRVEVGIGYALMEMPTRALQYFDDALRVKPDWDLAKQLADEMLKQGADISMRTGTIEAPSDHEIRALQSRTQHLNTPKPAPISRATRRTRQWRDVRVTARMHVEAGRYADALALYDTSILADEDALDILVESAECHLLAREYGTAVDFALQALDRNPKSERGFSILAEGRLKRREFAKALDAVHTWTSALPHDGHAQYVGAKALLALGRLAEAREACERALELAPKHLPAMMLRRQIDRTIRRVRAQAGKAQQVPVDLPEHLRDLRPLLVAGKTAEAIAVLEGPAYANDPTARLLRADLLAFTEQLEAAEAAYAALGGVAAGVGRALVLVKLGRPKDALAACDELIKEHPGAAEAHEARALALQALNRGSEADEEMRRAAAADRQRSQMRVALAKP